VIKTFKCADTEALSKGRRVRRFVNIEAVARRKLRQLQIAGRLEDLRVPPGNRLETLKGERAGQHSIRRRSTMSKLKPVTPGELLREEFLVPMGLTRYRLAKEIGVPAQRIGDIVAGKRAITADTDLRLCRFFGLSNGYWLRAQAAYDTEVAEEALAKTLAKIKPWTRVAAKAGSPA
jgi:addiction module HigA family antidote